MSLVLPLTWLLVAPLLVASSAAAQPSPPARQRQDRRLALSALAEPPLPEVRVAAGNLTTLVFDAALEPDSLEVDRARFKLADVGEHSLTLEPASELSPGERLVVKVRFKDRALPEQAVLVLVSHPSEMDGKVEVERQTSTPEALRAGVTLEQMMERLERQLVESTLRRCQYHKERAAKELGLARSSLFKRLKQWGLSAGEE